MVGYAVHGFVDGFFKGRDKKFEWEDRDRDYERQQRLDKMAEERHAAIMARYGREAADWDRANRMRNAELGILDEAYDATVASGGEPVQTTAGAAADAEKGPKGPAPADDPRVTALGADLAAIPAPPMTSFAGMMERTTPAEELAARAEKEGHKTPRRARTTVEDAPGSVPYDPANVQASMLRNGDPARVAPVVMAPPAAPAAAGGPPLGAQPGAPDVRLGPSDQLRADAAVGRQVIPSRGMPQNPQLVTQGPGPTGTIPRELYELGAIAPRYQDGPPGMATQQRQTYVPGRGPVPASPADDMGRAEVEERWRRQVEEDFQRRQEARAPNPDHQFMQPGGMVADAAEAGKRVAQAGERAIGGVFELGANTVNNLINPYVRYATGYEFPTTDGRQSPSAQPAQAAPSPAAPQTGAEAPQLDPANPVPPMRAAARKGASPAEEATVEAVEDAVNSGAVSPPAADAARATTQELGVSPGKPMSESQYQRAEKSFMDRYMEVGAPMVLEHYVKTGQFAKAEAFQQFLDTATVRENMKDWGRAAAAIAAGDVDTALNTVLDAYKRMDYFNDTTEIVRKDSGVVYDKDGNAAGVKLVFRDPNTGTTFEQVYDDMDDAISLGMTLMDPLTSFEHMQQRAEQQRQYELGLAEMARENAKMAQERIDEFTKMILDNSKDEIGRPTITVEEAVAQARAMVLGPQSGAGAVPAEPPLARRP